MVKGKGQAHRVNRTYTFTFLCEIGHFKKYWKQVLLLVIYFTKLIFSLLFHVQGDHASVLVYKIKFFLLIYLLKARLLMYTYRISSYALSVTMLTKFSCLSRTATTIHINYHWSTDQELCNEFHIYDLGLFSYTLNMLFAIFTNKEKEAYIVRWQRSRKTGVWIYCTTLQCPIPSFLPPCKLPVLASGKSFKWIIFYCFKIYT